MAAQSRADMDFLAREIASLRSNVGELATRDFVRGELRSELRELAERLERTEEEETENREDPIRTRWPRSERPSEVGAGSGWCC